MNFITIFVFCLITTACCMTPKLTFANSLETIFFLSDDLSSATEYRNSRKDQVYQNASMSFNMDFNKNDIMYARPANYTWGVSTVDNTNYLKLLFSNTSNYAYLQKFHKTSDILTKIGENRYKLEVDGGMCFQEGCILDENIISVVFPQKFKITKYNAAVNGSWKIVDNTYTFYSEKINGASTTFELEDTVPQVYVDLAKVLARFSDIKVTYDGNNVHVVTPVEGVFNSGDATIQKNGEKWIKIFGDTMKNAGVKELRVEGHSDSAPIKSKVYPSNWELSAARSAAVVRFLVTLGVDPKLLASVGYADSRPVADNKTPESRKKNRRIEFTIVPDFIKTASDSEPQKNNNIDLALK